jgi:hypothetical protein
MIVRTDVSTMVGHKESILIVTEAVCYFHNGVRVAVQVPVCQVLDVGINLAFYILVDISTGDVFADNSAFDVFADNSAFDVVADNRAFDVFTDISTVDVFADNGTFDVFADNSTVDFFVVSSAFGVAVEISVFDVPVGISAVDQLPSQSTHFLLSHSWAEKEKSLRIGSGTNQWQWGIKNLKNFKNMRSMMDGFLS